MEPLIAILVFAEAFAVTCAVAGRNRASGPILEPVGLGLCGAAAVLGIGTALGFHEPDVASDRLAVGALWGAALYALAAAVFYIVGRVALSRNALLGGIVVLALMAGLVVYVFGAALIIADYASCTPDQYECPV